MQPPSQPDLFGLVQLWFSENFSNQAKVEFEHGVEGFRFGRIEMAINSTWELIGYVDKDGAGIWDYKDVTFTHYNQSDPKFFDEIRQHVQNKGRILGPYMMKRLK